MKYVAAITFVLLVAFGVSAASAFDYPSLTCRYGSETTGITTQADYDYIEPMDRYLKAEDIDGTTIVTGAFTPLRHAGKLMLTEISTSEWSDMLIILTEVIDLETLEFRQNIIGIRDEVDVQSKVGFCIKR